MASGRAAGRPFDCDGWGQRPPTADVESRNGVHNRYTIPLVVPPARDAPAVLEQARTLLMGYRIFPPHRMSYRVCTPDQTMQAGAVIIQRVVLGPLAVESAVRVVDVFDRDNKDGRDIGFSYVTLKGHMERGCATFFLRQAPAGDLSFNIESWSLPGNVFAAIGRPVARRVQKRFTREALAHFAAQIV